MRRRPYRSTFVLSSAASLAAFLAVTFGSSVTARAAFYGSRAAEKNPRDLLVITNRKTLRPRRLCTLPGRIVESRPSPAGKYVGALYKDPGSGRDGLWSFVLTVRNGAGKTVVKVDGVQTFAFSPDDAYLAITRGRPYEGATGFMPEATEIIDLRTKKRWGVPELESATELDWTDLPEDGLTLMAWMPTGAQKVWKYRMTDGACVPTPRMGVRFSPDGKYYYLTPKEAMDAGLCSPKDPGDSCIRAYSWRDEPVKLNLPPNVHRTAEWYTSTGHRLMVTEGPEAGDAEMEVDLATGKIKKLPGRLAREWTARRGFRFTREPSGQLRLWVHR